MPTVFEKKKLEIFEILYLHDIISDKKDRKSAILTRFYFGRFFDDDYESLI